MKTLEKLFASCQKINTAEQAHLLGGAKTTGSFCNTKTCEDGVEDMRNDIYDENGDEVDSWTVYYESC